jgi:hypothetical protein
MRDTTRGKVDLYANGARDQLGCFRDLKYEPAEDGRFAAVGFDNFVAAVVMLGPRRVEVEKHRRISRDVCPRWKSHFSRCERE